MNCKFLVPREEVNEISVVETFVQLFHARGSLILCNRVLNSNWTEWSTIEGVIVSITKFSIVIGSPRAYLSRNRRAITWVSNYSCAI